MLEAIAPKTHTKSLHHKSETVDLRKQECFKGFLPILSLILPEGETYDLNLDWSFS
jgi:hypothetical protein